MMTHKLMLLLCIRYLTQTQSNDNDDMNVINKMSKKYINNQPKKMMMTMITLYISRDLHMNTTKLSSVTHNVDVTMKFEKDFDFLLPCMRLNVQHFTSQFWNSHIFTMLISGFLQHTYSTQQFSIVEHLSLSFYISAQPLVVLCVTAANLERGLGEARKMLFLISFRIP